MDLKNKTTLQKILVSFSIFLIFGALFLNTAWWREQKDKASEHFIQGVEHAVLDGCFWFSTHFPTHFTVDETIALANRLHVKNLYLTQISHNYPPYAEAQRIITAYIKKEGLTTNVQLAYDGLLIKLST